MQGQLSIADLRAIIAWKEAQAAAAEAAAAAAAAAEAEAAAVAGAAAARPDALEQAQLAAVGAHE